MRNSFSKKLFLASTLGIFLVGQTNIYSLAYAATGDAIENSPSNIVTTPAPTTASASTPDVTPQVTSENIEEWAQSTQSAEKIETASGETTSSGTNASTLNLSTSDPSTSDLNTSALIDPSTGRPIDVAALKEAAEDANDDDDTNDGTIDFRSQNAPRIADASLGQDPMPPLRLSGSATVTPAESEKHIESLTKQILLKIIELEKYSVNYSQQVAKQGRWKGWRYTFWGEANAGLGLAGAIISVAYRGARIHHAERVKPAIQQNANFIPMIGNIMGGGAAVIEFGINGYHDIQARRHGYGPRAAVRKVKGIRDDIDNLLEQRAQMTNTERQDPSLAARVEINEAEAKVLVDMRDQALQEFERFHVGARRTIAFQQTQYFFDLAKNATNAIGYEFAYLSLHRHHRVWNGRAGAMWDVTGPLFMFGPIISRGVGKGVGELTRRSLRPAMKDANHNSVENLDKDLKNLSALIEKNKYEADPVLKAVERTGDYDQHNKTFAKNLAAAIKQRNNARLIATENIGAGMFVGGSKLASGILFTIAGFNRHYNTTGERANRVTNDLLFTASVVSLPATMFTILDTMRIQVTGEINRHKAAKAGTLPSQLAAKRLAQLNELETKLKGL